MPTRLLLLISLAAGVMAVPTVPWAQCDDGEWVPFPGLQTPRQETGAALASDRIYVVGGLLDGRPVSATGSVEVLDLKSGLWSDGPALPVPRDHLGCTALGDRVFVIGGYPGNFIPSAATWSLEPGATEWTVRAALPEARGAGWAVTHGDRIYHFGGVAPFPNATTTTFIYDPTSGWSEGTPMPTAREHLVAVTAGDFIYVIGGRAGASTNAVERYDPVNDRWEKMAPMPTARAAPAAAVLNGKIYVMGGETPRLFAVNEVYDIAQDEWACAERMAVPRHGLVAIPLDDRILLPGGGVIQGLDATSLVDAFVPALHVQTRQESFGSVRARFAPR